MKEHITKEQVEHIAWLARIKLTEEEKEKFTVMFNDILNYFRKIDEIETGNIEYTSYSIQIKNVMRDDLVRPSLSPEEALKNAPKKEKNFIKAPRMV